MRPRRGEVRPAAVACSDGRHQGDWQCAAHAKPQVPRAAPGATLPPVGKSSFLWLPGWARAARRAGHS